MADPLSVSSALVAIVAAAAQSSQILYQTVQSFRNHQRAIKQLREELEALVEVLESLQILADRDPASFQPLRLPLLQCHQACAEFNALIRSCGRHSGGGRTSFRDWARLRYMDGDVMHFTNMLAGYKSTIAIALADANLRSTSVTLRVLNEYKDMIQSTTLDLEDHLENINEKLESLALRGTAGSGGALTTTTDQQRIQNEKDSTEQCLMICEKVLAHIDAMRLLPVIEDENGGGGNAVSAVSLLQLQKAHVMTLSALNECSDKLNDTVSDLKAHRQAAQERLQQQRRARLALPGEPVDAAEAAQRLVSERQSVEQCLAICTSASQQAASPRVHVLEDVSMGHDGQQVFVSTLGDLFSLKNVSAGDGAIQFVGSVSDTTLQHYFQYQQQR
ncbi:hypothetical protein JX265_010930 [Neoarthrinium moseri]|uniref:Azaphilone pigments biosynthesis cluster protein L N-terminal domain-containing protein n=1 Tax=Neoarthrinium moseri TaxID=1658444 RepID=A0A9P9WDG6_9PEZI|nr:hypothetical protein JX265_010930 [Neoarthrinium moseri]